MQRKIGIIDLGSNTSRLIIMAYTPGVAFQLIDQLRERVRLSEGMGAENILRPEPMERTIRLLKVFRIGQHYLAENRTRRHAGRTRRHGSHAGEDRSRTP